MSWLKENWPGILGLIVFIGFYSLWSWLGGSLKKPSLASVIRGIKNFLPVLVYTLVSIAILFVIAFGLDFISEKLGWDSPPSLEDDCNRWQRDIYGYTDC